MAETVSDTVRLTKAQRELLERLSHYDESHQVKWASASELRSNPSVMGGFVRRGWAHSVQQEERPLHEGTIRYRLYQITPAGLAALESNSHE